jgi:hypothetical protein
MIVINTIVAYAWQSIVLDDNQLQAVLLVPDAISMSRVQKQWFHMNIPDALSSSELQIVSFYRVSSLSCEFESCLLTTVQNWWPVQEIVALFRYKEIQPQASQNDKLGSRGWQKKLWMFAIKAVLSDVCKRLLHVSANYIVWRRYMCTEVFFHYCILMWVTVYVFHCKTYWKQHFQPV